MSSYWFIPLIIESILLLAFIIYDSGWLATLSLIVAGLVIHFAGFINLVDVIAQNWLQAIYMAGGYVVVGTAWSFVKWTLYILNCKRKYVEDRDEFIRTHKGSGSETDLVKAKQKWRDSYHGQPKAPQVKDHKSDIAMWLFYWPFSAVSTVIRDFTKKLFNLVYNTVKDLFQGISDRIYADIEKE